MSIVSLPFYAAVFLALILYYVIPANTQWIWLLVLSIGFIYLNGSIEIVAVFFLMGFIAYLGARMMPKLSGKRRNAACILSVCLLAGILFVSKDLDFFNTPIVLVKILTGQPPTKVAFPVLQLIGMSYFTLSLIGYVLDVYWEKYLPETNFFKVLLFAGYFPQLTSGPITRFSEMSVQLFAPHSFDADRFIWGAERAIWGCFKKLVLADRAAMFVSSIFDCYPNNGALYLLGTFVYAFQLYADFSGCMDIVLGVSECFQIHLPENFNTPFASESLGEFWRRWHITMGVWFKEYLLYPLMKTDRFQKINQKLRKKIGKKYGKKLATSLSLCVLWFVIGVWHGGSLLFICASGLIPGFFLVLEELLEEPVQKLLQKLRIDPKSVGWRFVRRLRVLLTMCCSWITIRSGSVLSAARNVKVILTRLNFGVLCDGTLLEAIDGYDWIILAVGLVIMTVVGIWHEKGVHIREEFQKKHILLRWVVLIAAIFSILILGIYGPSYDASSFIYKQF